MSFGGGAGQEIWQDFTSRVMLSSEEYEQVVVSEGLAGMYMDPKLSRNQKEYAWFVRDMEKRSMIEIWTSASATLGIFFVEKKHNRLILIVDARRLNQRCRTPHLSLWRVGTFILQLWWSRKVFYTWRRRM